jgi:hypothetical protein
MRLLFICLIVVTSAISHAQEKRPYENLPKTPDAALISRVETNTAIEGSGASSVDIPLGNIEITGVTIPLLLQYSNTGIRVTDVETPVGLGWVLNTGGMITRTIYGIPDEYGWLTDRPNFDVGCWTQAMLSDYYYKRRDPSPDIFSYSINGKSGYFYFNENGILIKTLSSDGLKISVDNSLGTFGFSIIDENGITYKYGASEITNRRTVGFIGPSPMADFESSAPTAWKLSEIVTPSNEKITFEYDTYYFNTPMFISAWNFTTNQSCNTTTPNYTEFKASKCTDSYTIKLLKRITCKYKTTLFNYSDDNNSALMKKKLVSIKSYDPINNNPIGDITLSYHVSDLNSRLFLDTVKFYGTKRSREPQIYTFDYNKSTFEFGTIRKDLFGYYSQKFTDYGFPYNKGAGLGYPSVQSYITEVDRSVDENSILFSSLKKVTYPTGASIEYILEPNVVKSATQTISSPGLRLKTVNYYNADNGIVKSQDFSYGNIATNVFNGNYAYYYSSSTYWGGNPPRYFSPTIWSSEPIIGERNLSGSCYSSLKITDKVYSPTRGIETSYTINSYDNFFGVDHLKSVLKRKDYFKGNDQKVRSEIYDYTSRVLLDNTKYWELNDSYVFSGIYKDCDGQTYCSYGGTLCNAPTTYYAPLKPCYLIAGDNEICKVGEQVIDYTQERDSIVSYKKYEYNQLMQLSKLVENQSWTVGSTPRERISYYKYASDYDDALTWVKSMKRLNIIGKPLDVRKYIAQANLNKVVDANLFEYNPQGQLVKEYRYNYKDNLSQWSNSVFLPQNFDKIGEYQYDSVTFNLAQQINRSNVATSYLWGYNNLYPIVKVENIDINTLKKLVGSTGYSYTTDDQVLALVNDLKSKVKNSNILANVYGNTFLPGVGIASSIDQKGDMKYYSYDDHSRLESIKDKSNRFIARYDYNYYNDYGKDISDVFQIDQTELYFDGNGFSQTIMVESTKTWSISSKSSSFILCRKVDNTHLEIGCASYSIQGNRTGTVVLTNGEKQLVVNVYQTSAIDSDAN